MRSSEKFLRVLRSKLYRWWHRSTISLRGNGNVIRLNDSLLSGCRIEFIGNDNSFEIGSGARLWGVTIKLIGDHQSCRIGDQCRLNGSQLLVEDMGSRIQVGSGTTMYAATVTSAEGKQIIIGSGCLVAHGVDIRNTDAHSILDDKTRVRINPAADVVIHDRVWLGLYAQVLKGVIIASKSVIAAHSVVTKNVDPGTLVAGIPARVIKTGVDWDPRRLT